MATCFQLDCPQCLTRSSGFTIAFEWKSRSSPYLGNVLGICGVCNRGVTIEVMCPNGSFPLDFSKKSYDFPTGDHQIVSVSPTVEIGMPNDLPHNVSHFYLQGMENIRAERWDAAGAMFRKTLDVSTKLISPEDRGLNLYRRIEKLSGDGLLTPAMGEWSHEIRLDGNDAVHDEVPECKEDAEALQQFVEAFLRYAFSLPSLVARNRAKRSDEAVA